MSESSLDTLGVRLPSLLGILGRWVSFSEVVLVGERSVESDMREELFQLGNTASEILQITIR